MFQEPRQVRTDRTTTGGGRSIQVGAGESGYGSGRYTPLAGPQFSHAAAAVYTPGGPHTVNGRPIAPSLADYLPANPYSSPYSSPVRAPVLPPPQLAYGSGIYDYLIDPALFTPPLHRQAFPPVALAFSPVAPAFDIPPHQPESDPFQPLYQWVQDDIPDYLNVWTAPPSPVQQFTYPDPDIATDDYVANWVGAKLNLPLEPERGAVSAAPPLPAPMPVQPVVVARPKKRVRKSRAKGKGVAAAAAGAAPVPETPTTATPTTVTPTAAMEMMTIMTTIPDLAPEPVVLGPSPSETLAALQTAAAMSPSIPVPAAYRHVWFLNGRGRVSKTRDNNPRCRRCRKRHWAVSLFPFLFPLPFPQSLASDFGFPALPCRFWVPKCVGIFLCQVPPEMDGEMLTGNSRAAGASPAMSAPRTVWRVCTGLGWGRRRRGRRVVECGVFAFCVFVYIVSFSSFCVYVYSSVFFLRCCLYS